MINNKSLRMLFASIMVSIFVFSVGVVYASGAGVIPYYKKGGATYFLLGIDRHRPHDGWADLGGTGKPNKETAAKEGHEETMGTFSKASKHPLKDKKTGVTFFKSRLDDKYSCYNSKSDFRIYFVNVTDRVDSQGGMSKVISHIHENYKKVFKKHKAEKERKIKEKKKAIKKKLGLKREWPKVVLSKKQISKAKKTKYSSYIEKNKFVWVPLLDFVKGISSGQKFQGNKFYKWLKMTMKQCLGGSRHLDTFLKSLP